MVEEGFCHEAEAIMRVDTFKRCLLHVSSALASLPCWHTTRPAHDSSLHVGSALAFLPCRHTTCLAHDSLLHVRLKLCCIPLLETASDLPCTGTHEGCLGRLCKGPKEEIALDTLSVAFHAGCDSGQ